MPEGPVYTKGNYRTIDGGIPYLIKTAYRINTIATGTGINYSPSLIFNEVQDSVNPFSIYIQNQGKYVIPLLLSNAQQGALQGINFVSSQWSAVDFNTTTLISTSILSAAIKVMAMGASGTSTNQLIFNYPLLDFNNSDFINPTIGSNGGIVFPFTANDTFAGTYMLQPQNWYTNPITDTAINNYTVALYAELQQ